MHLCTRHFFCIQHSTKSLESQLVLCVKTDVRKAKEKAVETTAGCILRRKINIAVLDINGEAWYNVTKISAYQSK